MQGQERSTSRGFEEHTTSTHPKDDIAILCGEAWLCSCMPQHQKEAGEQRELQSHPEHGEWKRSGRDCFRGCRRKKGSRLFGGFFTVVHTVQVLKFAGPICRIVTSIYFLHIFLFTFKCTSSGLYFFSTRTFNTNPLKTIFIAMY